MSWDTLRPVAYYGAVSTGLGMMMIAASKALVWGGKKILHKLYDEKKRERTDLKPWEKTMIKAVGHASIALGAIAGAQGVIATATTIGFGVGIALMGTGIFPLSVFGGLITAIALLALGGLMLYQQIDDALAAP